MRNQQILTKAIQKAIDGGYAPWWADYFNDTKAKDTYLSVEEDGYITFRWESDHIPLEDANVSIPEIIFNHDFAKALWGEEEGENCPECGKPYEFGWRHHLTKMVIADDPIKYLGEHLNNTNT